MSSSRGLDAGIRSLAIDVEGVLLVGIEPLEGAAAAFGRLQDAGLALICASNTTSIRSDELARRLADAGFAVEPADVVTAPTLTARYIQEHHPGARCMVLSEGTPFGPADGLELVSERADVVILGGAGPAFTHAALSAALNELLDGAELIAMHRNRYWQTANGLALDTGAYLTGIEQVSGKTATVIGKPSLQFFESVLAVKDMAAESTAMIGDDIDNDVLAAQAAGLTGVLVRTGKFREDALAQAGGAPDQAVDSFADVPALFGL